MTKLAYDENITFCQISPSAWMESQASKWFLRSKIYTTIDMGVYTQKLRSDNITNVLVQNTAYIHKIEADKGFVNYRKKHDHNARLLLNKPPLVNLHNTYYQNPNTVDFFEDKINLRKNLSGLPFAPYLISTAQELKSMKTSEYFERLNTEEIVVQIPKSSGGRGTKFASIDNFQEIIDRIRRHDTDRMILSKKIPNIKEYSAQGCIANKKVFVGPLQEQLIGEPNLVSQIVDSFNFCGGRIINKPPKSLYKEVASIVTRIGNVMLDMGYKGVFGVDFGVAGSKDIYVLEVNARKTALTPLLSSIDNAPPFYALHCLELLGEEYEYEYENNYNKYGSGYFVQVYAKNPGTINLHSGLYDYNGSYLGEGFEDNILLPKEANTCFVAMRLNSGSRYDAGKSLALIYSRDELFIDGKMVDRLKVIVDMIRS